MTGLALEARSRLPFTTLPPFRPRQREQALDFNRSNQSLIHDCYDIIASKEGHMGMFMWFVRPKPTPTGVRLRGFDRACTLTSAALIRLGSSPELAAILVDLELVLPEVIHTPDQMARLEFADYSLLDVVITVDGQKLAILAKRTLWQLELEQVQDREAYFVSAMRSGRLSSDNVREVANSIVRSTL